MLKILLAGDGGQGVQLISKILSNSVFESGLDIMQIPNYGLEQRGGVSLSFIKISEDEIVYPKFSQADVVLILSDQARERIKNYIGDKTEKIDILDFKDRLKEQSISLFSFNIFFLGVILKKLKENKIDILENAFKLLEEKLSTKPNWEENKKAFEMGLK